MLTVYQVWREKDMTEGRLGKEPTVTFTNETDAWKYANSQSGIMGRKPPSGNWRDYSGGEDWTVKPLTLYESYEECSKQHQKELKLKALSKLTTAEKKALGF